MSDSLNADKKRSYSPPRSGKSPSLTPTQTPDRKVVLTPPSSSRRNQYSDRFIPSRTLTNLDEAFDKFEPKSNSNEGTNINPHENKSLMNNLLRSELLGDSSLLEFPTEGRVSDSFTRSPKRKDSTSSLFKFRSSTGSVGSVESNNSINDAEPNTLISSSTMTRSIMNQRSTRKISKAPYKVLDAPSLQDDYYLNLVDWSPNNVVAVALGSGVYLWSAHTCKVTKLCEVESDEMVTSVAWAKTGNFLAVGSSSGSIQIWDCNTSKMVREMQSHDSRVGALAWSTTCLASGSRDRSIMIQDVRFKPKPARHSTGSIPSPSASSSENTSRLDTSGSGRNLTAPLLFNSRIDSEINNSNNSTLINPIDFSPGLFGRPNRRSLSSREVSFDVENGDVLTGTNGKSSVSVLTSHRQEVCGLKWSFDEKMIASGGNDNKLYVWEPGHGSTTEPLFKFEDHTAAVKAVAWSPHQNGLLASGGGTADRHIRFWNASTGVPLHNIDTGSQVCNLMWSKTVNEVVSTHGYSLNQIILWKYPSMKKIATLSGHSFRVLYLAMSPDGQAIVTGAGDETLRFWNVFPSPKTKAGFPIGKTILSPSGSDIR